MTQIEFITGHKVAGLSDNSLFDYILDQIQENRIVILEKELDAGQQMELIALGLEKITTEHGTGINFKPFFISTEISGLIRNKHQEVQFNLISPPSSKIIETEKGSYSVRTSDGSVLSAAL